MTLANVIGYEVCLSPGGLVVEVYPEAASQSFVRGEWCNLNSGLLQRGMTAHASNNLGADGASTTLLLGKPCDDASGVTRSNISVVCAHDHVLFPIAIWHGTDSGTNCRLREALLGNKYEVGNRTANVPSGAGNVANTWVLDTSATTNPKARVVKFAKIAAGRTVPGLPVNEKQVPWDTTNGEKFGVVYVKILASSRGLS